MTLFFCKLDNEIKMKIKDSENDFTYALLVKEIYENTKIEVEFDKESLSADEKKVITDLIDDLNELTNDSQK